MTLILPRTASAPLSPFAPVTSFTLPLGDASIAIRESGAGEPVVLLHCSAGSGAQWQSLMTALDDDFRVLAPDLWGYGDSDSWHGRRALKLADEAAIVAALMDHCGEPLHLVGHSYGGAVALKAASLLPRRVRSLTLIEPVSFHLLRGGSLADAALFDEVRVVADSVRQALMSGNYAAGMQQFVDYWAGDGTWEAMKPTRRAALMASAGKVALDFWATMSEHMMLRACRPLTMPTLILTGEASPAPTRRIAELLTGTIATARAEVVPGAGHMLPLTHPDLASFSIIRHLNGLAAPAMPLRRCA